MLYEISVRVLNPVDAGFHGLKGTSTAQWWGICWKAPLSCTALLQMCFWLFCGPPWYAQLALVSFKGASYLDLNAQLYHSGREGLHQRGRLKNNTQTKLNSATKLFWVT